MTTPASFSVKMTQELSNIEHPHEHDVLSGRGNFVNYHEGNEYYRILVRKYKLEYVRCPKPQKGNFSRTIVDAIKARNPPGRFLKQDATTKLWYDIGDKKALDKTRQALREGAPEIVKEITSDSSGESDDGHRAVQTVSRALRPRSRRFQVSTITRIHCCKTTPGVEGVYKLKSINIPLNCFRITSYRMATT